MATNNAVNISGSGTVKYDGAGIFSVAATPYTVPNQGTGDASLTTYAVLCGGTTSTGNVQSIASVGTANQTLTSNGSASLPTFETAPAARVNFTMGWTSNSFNPSSSTTYYVINQVAPQTTHAIASTRYYFVNTGTVRAAYGLTRVSGTLGSAQNVTIYLRLNNTTNTNITTTSQWTAVTNTFNNTNLGISVVAGDYVELAFNTPSWSTSPTSVFVLCTIFGTY